MIPSTVLGDLMRAAGAPSSMADSMLAFCRIMIMNEEGALQGAARELATGLAVPMFVVDRGGNLVYFNDHAGFLLGLPFHQAGEMTSVQWTRAFEPTDQDGNELPPSELPLVVALDERRPAHKRVWIRAGDGRRRALEISAFPLLGAEGKHHGAVALFWEVHRERRSGTLRTGVQTR
jgi:PAS domain-containing protein